MAITDKGATTPNTAPAASTSINADYPTGIAAGDMIVLLVTSANATAPSTGGALSGVFTSQLTGNSGGSSPSFRTYTRIADGSESGSITVTLSSGAATAQMLLRGGVDQVNPIDVAGTTFGSSTGVTAYNIPTLTTTMTGVDLIYCGVGNSSTGTWTPPTVPAAFAERHDTASPLTSTVGDLIWSGSGATGTVNLTRSTSIRGCAGMIALRPAAVVSGTPIIRRPLNGLLAR